MVARQFRVGCFRGVACDMAKFIWPPGERWKASGSAPLELNHNSVEPRSLVFIIPMRQTAADRRAPRASAFRRVLTVVLVAIYLIVGFGVRFLVRRRRWQSPAHLT